MNINTFLTCLWILDYSSWPSTTRNCQHATMHDQSVGEQMNCGLYCISLFFIHCGVPKEA